MIDTAPARGLTPNELARLLRVSADKIRRWIKTGHLGAVNVAGVTCARPQFVILPHHLAEWERLRSAAPPPKPPRRRKRIPVVDYYSD
jgi:excisionase family DNA binding protein